MNDVLIPEWLKELENEADLDAARRDAAEQRAIAAQLALDTDGPEFWHQLLKGLSINSDALEKMKKVGVRGHASTFGNPRGGEQRCRVDIARTGIMPKLTWTDLFYTPGDSAIRCHTLEGEVKNFAFCILPKRKGLGVLQDGEFAPMNAEEMAETIVMQMVSRVRSTES
jgi:hypothetical protein